MLVASSKYAQITQGSCDQLVTIGGYVETTPTLMSMRPTDSTLRAPKSVS